MFGSPAPRNSNERGTFLAALADSGGCDAPKSLRGRGSSGTNPTSVAVAATRLRRGRERGRIPLTERGATTKIAAINLRAPPQRLR
jgi:hypothetical protein